MAYTRTPKPVQVLLRALDAKFGAAAGVLYLGTLRQVRRYLGDAAVKSEIDRIVADAVTPDCRVLIGHSLGTVVARFVLVTAMAFSLPLWTCGSTARMLLKPSCTSPLI